MHTKRVARRYMHELAESCLEMKPCVGTISTAERVFP
jgi:hypothetical protein